MPTQIHPTACIDPSAQIGEEVTIGAYAIVGSHVVIGDRTKIAAHAVIDKGTILGTDNEIHYGVVLGDKPQDRSFDHEESRVVIGNHNQIREYATIHKATGEGKSTHVGNHCFLMTFVHLAHNCQVGNDVTITSMTQCGGHVVIEDYATIGAMVAVPQFIKIGTLAMVGAYSRLYQDVPPFMLADGNPAAVHSINAVGIKRNPQIISKEKALIIKKAYHILYRQNLIVPQALDKIHQECLLDGAVSQEILHLITFIRNAKKGICKSARKKSLGLL